MGKSESWKTWAAILAVLILFGLVTAVWPAFTGFQLFELGEPETRTPVEVEPIHLNVPAEIMGVPLPENVGGQTLTIQPLIAIGVVTALVIGGIVVVGGGLAFVYTFLDRQANRTREEEAEFNPDDSFLTPVYGLLDKGINFFKSRTEGKFEDRTTHPVPEHNMPRWTVISNTLIALMFTGFLVMVVVRTFVPEGRVEIATDELGAFGSLFSTSEIFIDPATPVFLVLAVIIVGLAAWRMKPQKIEAMDETDDGSIPWDFIAVLVTGLIMIGIGVGLMAYLNSPA